MRPATAHDIDWLLAGGNVRPAYQPVVRLDTEAVVGFEALARGPEGSALAMPDQMFAAARAADRVQELDEHCMVTSISNAERLPKSCLLFVNVEPLTLSSRLVSETAPIAAAGGRSIMLEITERAITRSPEALLAGVATAREHGWRVALDDVGVDPGSLAFLPLLRPDVVKLDMALIRGHPDRDRGRTMSAVMAYAERSGAIVLAEGIETDEHLERALSLGATWGQGYRFGHPAPLPADVGSLVSELPPPPLAFSARAVMPSPYDAVVASGHKPRVARKSVLLQISHHLEEQALADPNAPLLLAAFQHARHFTAQTADRYRVLGGHCGLCAALGTAMSEQPAPGVRGAVIYDGDPLTDEWSVVVLGPHYIGALLGKDLGDTGGPDTDRRFSYVVTHDRDMVELAAESLVRRVIAT